MGEVAYVSQIRIERKGGPIRLAHLPGEAQPVAYGLHGAIAEHYGIDMNRLKEVHATTIDHVIGALGG